MRPRYSLCGDMTTALEARTPLIAECAALQEFCRYFVPWRPCLTTPSRSGLAWLTAAWFPLVQVMNEEHVALRAYLSRVVSQEQRMRAWLQGQQSACRVELAMSAAQQQLSSHRQQQRGEPELEEGDISHVSISEGRYEADATSTSGTAHDRDNPAQEELEMAKAAATLTEMASATIHQAASCSESEEVLVSPQRGRPSPHTRPGGVRAERSSAARSPRTRANGTVRAGGRLATRPRPRPRRATEKYGAQAFWQRFSLAAHEGEGHISIEPGCWWCQEGY